MRTSFIARTVAVAAVAATLVTGAELASPASAAGSPRSVTVFLTPPDASALAALARSQGGTREQRLAQLRALLPSNAQHAAVAAAFEARGFTVTDESIWSVTATAPQTQVTDLFGSRPALAEHPDLVQRTRATGAFPHVPVFLRGRVLAAFPTTGGPNAFHPATTYAGPGFRDAYTSTGQTAAGDAPAGGNDRQSSLTIATIQLDGWNSSDLATYARKHGLSDGPGRLTQVPVDQAKVPSASKSASDEGDLEVGLDQESLLSTAPHARQRAYFAPNTDAGFADAYDQVLSDVLGGTGAYKGGDDHIVALSSSWGECESATDSKTPDEITDVLEPIMQSLVAAKVTLFSASGDAGVYDCTGGGLLSSPIGVDYPASSPEVIGVGGTKLSSSSVSANNGSNWTETAWTCASAAACTSSFGTGGSGGGASSIFAEPGYQSAHLSSTLNASNARLVPDIAADADPNSGFEMYTTDRGQTGGKGGTLQIGGTSLASPVEAALFTDMLAAHGVKHGVGDIHDLLYRAASKPGRFRDITTGRNGPAANDEATKGYDTVTGLGAPLWPAIGNLLFTGSAPKASVHLTRLSQHRVRVSWSGTAPSGRKLISAEVTVHQVGQSAVRVHRGGAAPHGHLVFTGKPGTSYRVSVIEVSGNNVESRTANARIHVRH